MASAWKTVRVFISSTFRDMHSERDHLVRVVFPELRERCAKRHLHLIDVDLRWGVTEEDAQRGKALEICLREIEDCRPFFIGLLGERYGWIPPRYEIPDEEKFSSLRNVESGQSITAIEIAQGALSNPEMRQHAFFYFRDPAFIDSLPPEKQSDFRSEDGEHAEKLRILKQRIRTSGLPVRENYRHDDLEGLGRQVLEDLWMAIQAEHPEQALQPDPLDVERSYHDFLIETRTELFIGQRHLLARLHGFASGEMSGPMVVTGTPGCGKSALLARFVSQFRRIHPGTFLLYHFVGASPSSTDPRRMLLRLCQELARRFGFTDEISQDYNELRVRFWQFCLRAAERGRWVLVLDALNQLDGTYHAHDLDWLPALMPPAMRLILSSLEGDALNAARQKYREKQELNVTPLRLGDQGFVIARQLKAARKSLSTARDWRRQWRAQHGDPWQLTDPIARKHAIDAERRQERSQLRFILTGAPTRDREPMSELAIRRETANPLYLKLVSEELRLFGEYDRLPEFIANLPTDVPGMFHNVLARLEGDYGRKLVEHALSLIAIGRHGRLEGELLESLARSGEERLPLAVRSRLYRSLTFYFKPRASDDGGDDGLIDFFHQQLADVVRTRYLRADQDNKDRHAELVAYFRGKGDPGADDTWKGDYPRSLSELVHHQIGAHLWDDVEKTLASLFFLEANINAGRTFDLPDMFFSAVNALPENHTQRRILKLLDEAIRRDIHFIARHAKDYRQGLFQCLWNTCWWYDSPQASARYSSDSLESNPWNHNGPRLYQVLEAWRRKREEVEPGFLWVQSRTPPLTPLGTSQVAILRGHEDSVTGVAWFPDELRIVSGSRDKTVRIWDRRSGAEIACLRGHVGSVEDVAVAPNGRYVASVASEGSRENPDSTVRVWDANTLKEEACLRGHRFGVNCVTFSPDGQFMASAGEDGTVRLWDLGTFKEITCLAEPTEKNSRAIMVTFSPSGKSLAALWVTYAVGAVAPLVIWNVPDCSEQLRLDFPSGLNSVGFSPDGRRIVVGDGHGEIQVLDVGTGVPIAACIGHERIGPVFSASFFQDGQRVVTGSYDGTIRVAHARDLSEVVRLRGHDGVVSSVSPSPSDAYLVSGGDNTVRLWRTKDFNETPLQLRGHDSLMYCLAFCPDGHHFATGSSDGDIIVWDSRTGSYVKRLLGHESSVNALDFTADARLMASGSYDRTVILWDFHRAEILAVLKSHAEPVRLVVFSPDGSLLASSASGLGTDNVV